MFSLACFSWCYEQCAHIYARTVTTTAIDLACPKCGTIKKSGKTSCCGRGGSWFKNCGRTVNKRLQYTWYEGIQACKKAQSMPRLAFGQRGSAAQQKVIGSHYGDGQVNPKEVISRVANVSESLMHTKSVITTVSTSPSTSTTQGTHTTNSRDIAYVSTTIISMSTKVSTPTPTITLDKNSTPIPVIVLADTSITVQGCDNLLYIMFHIRLLVTWIIVFRW